MSITLKKIVPTKTKHHLHCILQPKEHQKLTEVQQSTGFTKTEVVVQGMNLLHEVIKSNPPSGSTFCYRDSQGEVVDIIKLDKE